jgi:hypothetical protein
MHMHMHMHMHTHMHTHMHMHMHMHTHMHMHMQVLYERHGKQPLERLTRQFFEASAEAEVGQLVHTVVTFDDFYRRFVKPWPKVSCTHTCTRAQQKQNS